MRQCKKNQRTMYYALYNNKTEITDESGFEELESTIGYSNPVMFKASTSTGQSNAEEKPFGTDVSYDRIISSTDKTLPIDENSIIWLKNTPIYNEDGTVNGDSADYKVAAHPLDGLNSLLIAIKKVEKTVTEEIGTEEEIIENGANNEPTDSNEDNGF